MLARLTSLALVLSLATVGACTDAPGPGPVCGTPRYYAIDHVDVAQRAGEGALYGLDLDGDGNVDNAFASLGSLVQSGSPELGDLNATINARMPRGDQAWLIGVSDCDDGSTQVQLGESGGGDEVPLTMLADPVGTYAPVSWVRVGGLRARVQEQGDKLDGVVGFALPVPAATPALVAPFAAYMSRELAAGTSPLAVQTDTNHDGVVSTDELMATDWIRAFTAPDVSLEGKGGPVDGMSAGIGVHATRVTIE